MTAPAAPAAADEQTTRPGLEERLASPPSALALTIAYHPDLRRVGERVLLRELAEGRACELARGWPEFRTVEGRSTGALADPSISRAPLVLVGDGADGVYVRGPHAAVMVDGRRLGEPRLLAAHELEDGVLIQLGGVLLLLHVMDCDPGALPKYSLVGESAALQRVRADILHVAGQPQPVLLRGESGTGKELVARALHAASPRASRPCVCINLAALSPQTAVAELFGHARGAFTGAIRARDGYFREADAGTLFLDEIGEAPLEVQVMLLRALETGEIQPVGGGAARQVDVRLIAATDANLEEAALRGGFRVSLLHRLAGYEIWMPPLRQRRDDIPRLFMHFARSELLRCGVAEPGELLHGGATRPPAALMERMIRHDWPGNVRQLNNVARQFVALTLARRHPAGGALLGRLLAASDEPPARPQAAPAGPARAGRASSARGLAHINDQVLLAALRHNRWRIDATAGYLGISKTSLYALIDRCPRIRKARDLTREELLAAEARHRGDLGRMSDELCVSLRGLKLRIRELGLAR